MPAIFNEQNWETTRIQMLEQGGELLKKYGVKRMTIDDIVNACGFARATFYKFFPSKEEYVYQIIRHRRELVKQKYADMVKEYGQIGRPELIEFFQYTWNNNLSAFQYLTEQDMNYLAAKWPREYQFNPQADEKTTRWLISHMKGVREGIDWKVMANIMKTLAMMDMTKKYLHEDALEKARMVIIEGMLAYLYE